MKAFSDLYTALEELNTANGRVSVVDAYFREAAPEDAIWALYLLDGRWSTRLVSSRDLESWAAAASGLPEWLVEDSCRAVNDTAEAAALLVPEGRTPSNRRLHYWIERRLLPLASQGGVAVRESVMQAWSELDFDQRLLFNKLLTAAFRPPVSRKLLIHALAQASGLEISTLAHRVAVSWEPTVASIEKIFSRDTADADRSRCYPFCLPVPLDTAPERLGRRDTFQAEWKWDGLRAQVVRRGGRVFIWSRGAELVTDRFPEIRDSALALPDGLVLDGVVLADRDGKPLPLSHSHRRFGKKRVSRRTVRDMPVLYLAFDLLELSGDDLRVRALRERRALLERTLRRPVLRIRTAPLIDGRGWDDLSTLHEDCRARMVGGMILKDLEAPYSDRPRRGAWWTWSADPYSIDAVLTYVQTRPGAANGFEYTFAVWDSEELVPVATTSAWPDEDECDRVDRFVEDHTLERYGPVRSVEPVLVCEIAFDGVFRSSRHKSGVTVRSPRVLRLRTDLDASDAGTAASLRALAPHPAVQQEKRAREETTISMF